MSLPHAILGLLNYRAMTGYDLKRDWFDRSMRFFWPADQAQIYRALERLVEHDWASFTVEAGGDRPNRKVYSLTADGRAELTHWLTTPAALPTVRDPLLVQLFCAADIADDDIARLLAATRAEHQARLDNYRRIQAQLPTLGSGKRLQLWQLVLGNGIERESSYLAWLDHALASFSGDPEPNGSRPTIALTTP
ncbi:MAG: PadR family transcriptional regulator [Chloroflexia bacterium]|nr:PadR family transcriptional regulator [Chloroflexia bacterium]MDQ3412961.1 PadR family transcriptional regulator [Chloroflexota bacterium]